jgi:hypothetical protein
MSAPKTLAPGDCITMRSVAQVVTIESPADTVALPKAPYTGPTEHLRLVTVRDLAITPGNTRVDTSLSALVSDLAHDEWQADDSAANASAVLYANIAGLS